MVIGDMGEAARAMEKVNRALAMAKVLAASVDRAQAVLHLSSEVSNSGLSTLLDHAIEDAGDITRFLRAEPYASVPGA
ncbi:hypothetical protein Lfu02_80570 [Longispora fulva]|uniref:Uncharacterized protein n=1 Tax=Longispora fulva TaxID=619741 RepID=A0A8J7GYN9_9ACTN|nr:hypothetical protein [Longispora fulva]MBG6140701.1 hypothetical protein [Longispora fulva]GIG63685.1 hypothetical protein Lfu02_80570 [Longispora fulva]